MESSVDEKEKKRMEKAANYPWAETVGTFEMTKDEKKEAEEDLICLIEKFKKKD